MFVILWILFSALVGAFAKRTGRNPGTWFFIACLTSPGIGAILLLIGWLLNGSVKKEVVSNHKMFGSYEAAYNYVTNNYNVDMYYRSQVASEIYRLAHNTDDCDKIVANYVG